MRGVEWVRSAYDQKAHRDALKDDQPQHGKARAEYVAAAAALNAVRAEAKAAVKAALGQALQRGMVSNLLQPLCGHQVLRAEVLKLLDAGKRGAELLSELQGLNEAQAKKQRL